MILEVEWEDKCTEPQVERVVPVYNKTDVSGLETFLRDKFVVWASNGSNVEEIWNNLKNIIYESIEQFVRNKTLRKISDPEYYNKEIKRLKSKVRKENNKKIRSTLYREIEKTIKAATCIQEIGTGGILKKIQNKECKC